MNVIKNFLIVLWLILKALISMILKPARHPERSWKAEYVCRLMRNIFEQASVSGLPWLRKLMDAQAKTVSEADGVFIYDDILGGVPVHGCRPLQIEQPKRVLVYLHGGGYVFGSVKVYHQLMAQLAREMKALVIGVEYRLGPEHKFPAANDDCLAATLAVLEQYEPRTVTIAGDSAGGALTLATAVALKENGHPMPAACAVMAPWSEPRDLSGSMKSHLPYDIFPLELFQMPDAQCYVTQALENHPRVNISQANLTGLPPLYIQTGSVELFYDQNKRLEKQAREAGVDVTQDVYEGMFHVFQLFPDWLIPQSSMALNKLGQFLYSHTPELPDDASKAA
ncbi:alpha/beta hydrolase [Spongorhabdus nitratireducens]